jgi:hypothetical protein
MGIKMFYRKRKQIGSDDSREEGEKSKQGKVISIYFKISTSDMKIVVLGVEGPDVSVGMLTEASAFETLQSPKKVNPCTKRAGIFYFSR